MSWPPEHLADQLPRAEVVGRELLAGEVDEPAGRRGADP